MCCGIWWDTFVTSDDRQQLVAWLLVVVGETPPALPHPLHTCLTDQYITIQFLVPFFFFGDRWWWVVDWVGWVVGGAWVDGRGDMWAFPILNPLAFTLYVFPLPPLQHIPPSSLVGGGGW